MLRSGRAGCNASSSTEVLALFWVCPFRPGHSADAVELTAEPTYGPQGVTWTATPQDL